MLLLNYNTLNIYRQIKRKYNNVNINGWSIFFINILFITFV